MPTDWWLDFWVKEERNLAPDPTLGSVRALFQPGARTAHDFVTVNHGVGGTPAPGSPQRTNGSFWLGVTKAGKIRGNEGKEDDGYARVYLETFSELKDPRAPSLRQKKSRRHTVRRI